MLEDQFLSKGFQAQEHLDTLLTGGGAMVQPFMFSVSSYGERALVHIGGAYSHAASKVESVVSASALDT